MDGLKIIFVCLLCFPLLLVAVSLISRLGKRLKAEEKALKFTQGESKISNRKTRKSRREKRKKRKNRKAPGEGIERPIREKESRRDFTDRERGEANSEKAPVVESISAAAERRRKIFEKRSLDNNRRGRRVR